MYKSIWALLCSGLLAVSCSSVKDVEKMTVASQQADCVGVAPQKCLLIKINNQTDWEFWYSGIEGFEYEPGYEYVLEVKKETIAIPASDRSTIQYVLVKEVSKTKKTSENLPSIPR